MVGRPNGLVKEMSANALNWVKENVQAYFPKTYIVGIAVGNEVLGDMGHLKIFIMPHKSWMLLRT